MNVDPARARAIFLDAVENEPPDTWDHYLDAACAGDADLRRQVAVLLDAHRQAGNFLAQGAIAPGRPADRPLNQEGPGTVIGPYKLLQQIGEGGMGTVFMAEQLQPVQRQVALKIVKPGMDSRKVIARFEAERQALALMDHPNIARVLDAGTTPSGRPFFVMELVKGVPITGYCDERHLTPNVRLELFQAVCQAVQHAHQKGIIHRDLKPSNVLVAEYDDKPVVKVIDFGVAKATGPKLTERTMFTEFGQVVGTLEYMSPEQAKLNALDIDTRSDIYALGVLLYELLAGTTPFEKKRLREAAFDEILRIIREEQPPRPSTRLSTTAELPSIAANRGLEPQKLSSLMRGELDWVVMKCLEKDRNRRYETANGLARDIERYLHDEPVLARPASVAYRFRKFARRNKGALATAMVVGAMLLASLGAIAGSVGWVVRDHEAQQARLAGDLELALAQAELLADQGKWAEAHAGVEYADRLAQQVASGSALLDRQVALRDRLGAQAQDQAFVAEFEQFRLEEQSQVNEVESRFSRERAFPRVRQMLKQYGIEVAVTPPAAAVARIQGRPATMQGHLLAALDECLVCAPKGETQACQWLVAVLTEADDDPWRVAARQALGSRDASAIAPLARTADVTRQPASFLLALARALRPPTGRTGLRLCARIQRQYPGDFWANHQLGWVLAKSGQPAEAVPYYTAALALRPHNAGVHVNRANALTNAEELDAALADLHRAIALAPTYATAHSNLGNVLRLIGDLDGAVAACRQAIALDANFPTAHDNLGRALASQGNWDEAVAAYQQALAIDANRAVTYFYLGNALRENRDPKGAIAAFRRATELNPQDARAHYNLARLLEKHDREEAIESYRKAIAARPELAEAHNNLGRLLMATDVNEAIMVLRAAVAADPDLAMAHVNLGRALQANKQVKEAITHLRRAADLLPLDVNVQVQFANALMGQRKVDDAIPWYRKAIAMQPANADAHFGLAMALRVKDPTKLDEIIACFRRAVELRPGRAVAWLGLGSAYETRGQWSDAISAYGQAIGAAPKLVATFIHLGNLVNRNPQLSVADRQRAVAVAKGGVTLAPESHLAWLVLGWTRYRAGDWQGCIDAMEKSIALQKNPKGGTPQQWFFLAMAHWRLDHKDQALKWYDQAVRWLGERGANQGDLRAFHPDELRRFQAEAAKLLKSDESMK
jgi:serine/threonine protein kinase/Flp pilus assembly protein TadD